MTNTADSGPGSLRWAISNANVNVGADNIDFQIAGTPPFTINLLSALPAVTDPVIIDATTQLGYSSAPVVELNGTNAGVSSVGLELDSASNTIKGLVINRFGAQGMILVGGANVIQGNFIGTDATGAIALRNGSHGILVESSGNLIGGGKAGSRNVISGGNDTGIYIYNTSSNMVQGNYIGLSSAGTNALGNRNNGVMINGSRGNLIGGGTAGARNLISGNGTSGVFVNGVGATGNLVQNNYIGTDVTGELAISNADDGISVSGAPSNTISGNVISGNGTNGVFLAGLGATGNTVAGNYLGTDALGKAAMGNGNAGVVVTGAGNIIGGSNVISGNSRDGIFLVGGATGNLVQGNFIGTSTVGTNALPNGVNGIEISGASSNKIGGSVSAARNVISGNTANGVLITSVTDSGNVICGNYIGADVTGRKAVANALAGIRIQGCSNTVGGIAAGSGNVIAGNGQQGIYLVGNNGNVTGNVIQGNLIGLDVTGVAGLRNTNSGVCLNGAANTQIGGTSTAARNVISANGNSSTGLGGVFIGYAGATNNLVQGNYIGTDVSGTVALSNVNDGVYLYQSAENIIGGSTAGAGNLISANGIDGIYLSVASWNTIQGNYVGTKADGASALGNKYHNVELDAGATNNIIGGFVPAAGNRIAFAPTSLYNGVPTPFSGVRVRNSALNDLICGNSIFSNAFFGIDLGGAGANPNVDCESGVAANAANRGQNYPVLTAVYSGTATLVRGTLGSAAGKSYTLQFFSSPAGNTNGYGEGQFFLGQTNLTLGASCSSNFTAWFPAYVPAGWVVTATATDTNNNTSEFSVWVPVMPVPQVQSSPVNPTNRQFAMFWTNNGGNYILQQTFSLAPPQQWVSVTNAPPANGVFMLSLPATNAAAFYRLAAQ